MQTNLPNHHAVMKTYNNFVCCFTIVIIVLSAPFNVSCPDNGHNAMLSKTLAQNEKKRQHGLIAQNF